MNNIATASDATKVVSHDNHRAASSRFPAKCSPELRDTLTAIAAQDEEGHKKPGKEWHQPDNDGSFRLALVTEVSTGKDLQ